jgi:hypothetical protein
MFELQKYGPTSVPNIIVVGNKCDQPAQVHYDIAKVNIATVPPRPFHSLLTFFLKSKMYADQLGASVIYASAATGKGVIELFNTLAKQMGKQN